MAEEIEDAVRTVAADMTDLFAEEAKGQQIAVSLSLEDWGYVRGALTHVIGRLAERHDDLPQKDRVILEHLSESNVSVAEQVGKGIHAIVEEFLANGRQS